MTSNARSQRSLFSAQLLLTAFVCAAPPLAARADNPERTSDAATRDVGSAKELRRVLSLVGGGFVRAKTRLVGDAWEYHDGQTWKSIPSERVERAVEEAGLLAQAESLAKHVGKDLGARRVAYADWLGSAGLLTESVKELDRVLAAEPDSHEALELAARLAPVVRASHADPRTDEGLTEWFRSAANFGPTLREIAVTELGRRADGEKLHELARRDLSADSQRLRAFAALLLRRLHPGAELRELISRSVLDGSEDVRKEAALALKAANEPAVVVPLVRALGSSYSSVRSNAIEALGRAAYPAAIAPLVDFLAATSADSGSSWRPPAASLFVGTQTAYVQDYDVEVAQFAAVAKPQVNVAIDGAALDVRIISVVETDRVIEMRRVRDVLNKLTDANPGDKASDWVSWWKQNAARFAPAAARPATPSGS